MRTPSAVERAVTTASAVAIFTVMSTSIRLTIELSARNGHAHRLCSALRQKRDGPCLSEFAMWKRPCGWVEQASSVANSASSPRRFARSAAPNAAWPTGFRSCSDACNNQLHVTTVKTSRCNALQLNPIRLRPTVRLARIALDAFSPQAIQRRRAQAGLR